MVVHSVFLSSVDQLMPTSYVRLFLVIGTGAADVHTAIEYLHRGLEQTQQQLPYIGGTIFEETYSRRIGVRWEEDGHIPQIRIVPVPKDFPSSAQLEGAELPFSEIWRIGGDRDHFGSATIGNGIPALKITCSPLDGYLIIGVSCFHSLWDITGLCVFFHLWSKNTSRLRASAGVSVIENISSRDERLRRWLKLVSMTEPTEFKTNLEHFPGSDAAELDNYTLQLDISKLKKFGRRLSLTPEKKISSNDLAIAVIWTSISLNRFLREKQSWNAPRLRVLVDGRKHVVRPDELKIPFLGNLVLPLFSTLHQEQLPSCAFQKDFTHLLLIAIDAILSSSSKVSPSSLVEAIATLDKTSDASSIRETARVYNSKQLTSTSWSQAPMYVDFGAQVGKVEYVRIAPPDYSLEGMLLTLPRRRDGSTESDYIATFVALHSSELRDLRRSEIIRSLTFDRPKNGVRAKM